MTETPREIRESLIMQWYEKKFNRDELLTVLDWSRTIDDGLKKKIKKEIIQNFYENFDKAKEEERFKSADAEYRDIKVHRRQLKKISEKLDKKKLDTKDEKQRIEREMVEIVRKAMDLDDKSWTKRRKLKNTKTERDTLRKQQKEILLEISNLAREKEKLRRSLKNKEKHYGVSKRVMDIDKESLYAERKHQHLILEHKERGIKAKTIGLVGYREKYFQLIKFKEEYMKKILPEIEKMDLGISEEKKNEILELIKSHMEKDIEEAKGGDEITKLADERENWLEENWKTMNEILIDLRGKISVKEKEVKKNEKEEAESKQRGTNHNELLDIRKTQFELKKELIKIKSEYDRIKADLAEKLKECYGEGINSSKYFELIKELK